MKHFLSFFCWAYVLTSHAQPSSFAAGQGASAGQVGVAAANAFSAHNNPAAMSKAESFAIGLNASKPYLLDDLQAIQLSAHAQTAVGTIGLAMHSIGDRNYSERSIGLAVARPLSETIQVGLRMDYIHLSAALAGNESLFLPELGVTAQLSEAMTLGVKAQNILAQDLDHPFEGQFPAWTAIGLDYQPTERFWLGAQADLLANDALSVGLGTSYRGAKRFHFLVGARTRPALFTGGIRIHFSRFQTQVGSTYHQQLGASPHVVAQFHR